MRTIEIRHCLTDFLRLLESPPSEKEAVQQLWVLLDQLAVAQHFVTYRFEAAQHASPPRRDYNEWRRLAETAFPAFGFYNVVLSTLEKVGEGECGVGDAIDDVADIASELADVEWRWAHTSEDDALFHFHLTFRTHWGEHLRGLQAYLAVLRAGSSEPA